MNIIQLFKKEIKALIAFAKKPIYQYQQQPFNINLKRFCIILFIDIILLIIVTGLFYLITFFGLDEIFKTNKNLEVFNQIPLVLLAFLMILIIPLIEEFIFRLHLKYRRWVINLILPLLLVVLSISLLSIGVATVTIIIPLIIFVIYNQKITSCLKQIWDKKFNFVFYITTTLFALMHITNYELSLSVILLAPILILPQFIGGFFIGYLRIKSGFIWGVALHMASNAILMLPVILSLSMAFPSVNIQNKGYNLTIEKVESKYKDDASSTFSKDLITINNYSFKKCLSLLLDKEEKFIEFDDSFMAMGLPQLKAEILLHIDYKNQNSGTEIENTIYTNKQNILNELQRIYKFELITENNELSIKENNIESVKVIFQ